MRRRILILAVVLLAGCTPPVQQEPPLTMPSTALSSPSLSPIPSPSPSPIPSPSAALVYTFPVGGGNASYQRTHSGYKATDIFATCGLPVVAVTDGVVLEVNRVNRYDPARDDPAWRGGLFVSLKGDDGVRYYGAHLTEVTSGIEKGVRVRSGQSLGTVGKTGRASNVCHLHFGISPPCTGENDWWIRRGVVWPWSYLDAWRSGTAKSAAAEVTAWQSEHGCPDRP